MNDTLAIDIAGLRFGWSAQETLLDIPALRIARGERVFLHGASGSGKSTLLGLLGGVLTAQAGRVGVLGTDLATLPARARDRFRADHIGIVFQQFNLLPFLSARENVELAVRFSPRRTAAAGDVRASALRLIAALGLDAPRLAALPAHRLSIGEQQRVAAARALLGAPELVIADEPTSALDADARDTFLDLLFAECARAGSTLLFVSHERALAPRFTRTLALRELAGAPA